MENNLMLFEGKKVEVIELNGEVLFNANDVGEILEIKNVADNLRSFNQKQVVKVTNSIINSTDIRKMHNTGENFLTEAGVYRLSFKSRKPEAEKFVEWVTSEVLPSIRKTGGFVQENRKEGFMSNIMETTTEEGLKLIVKLAQEQLELRNKIEEDKPKVVYYERLVDNEGFYSFRETAKLLGIKEREFIKTLIEKGYLYRNTAGKLLPYATYTGENALFIVKEFTTGTGFTGVRVLITMKGREVFMKFTC